ncbi:hypothetical protein [Rhodococcus sp. BP22]|uniref:hypothetical protein n=1 Tax=Rhodococcus sp. BP22 TaxID=2758566 RepID=UPI0016479255|nr:hypothetical protein [Rhodococcus sp. BP22]
MYRRIKNPRTAADFRLSERYTNPTTDADWKMRERADAEALRRAGFFESQSGRLLMIVIIAVFLLWMYIAVI